MSQSFLFECREAARLCSDKLICKLLRDATDHVAAALNILRDSPTTENLQRVVGLWTKTAKLEEKALPLPNPTPRAGAGEIERMAA